jgi:hypothetical protein
MFRDIFIGSLSSAFRKVIGTAGSNPFNDDFNRANGSINPAEDGGVWQAIKGTFQISGNKASSLTDASHPIAAVDSYTSNVDVDIKGTSGAGAALWVTDSGNWWSVGAIQASESCNCVEYYNSYTYTYTYFGVVGFNQGNCASNNNTCCATGCTGNYNADTCALQQCGAFNTSNCCGFTCYGFNAYNARNKTGGNCMGNFCSCYNGSNCQYNICVENNGSNCNAFGCTDSNSCNNCASFNQGNAIYGNIQDTTTGYNGPYYNCETCYPSYIRIFQSASNVVTTMLTQAVSAVVQSIKVKTNGTQITVKAYSDANQVTQIGSDIVYTATGAAIYPRFGITIVPSSYGQTYAIDEVTITPNS